jgi:hypothetical protein
MALQDGQRLCWTDCFIGEAWQDGHFFTVPLSRSTVTSLVRLSHIPHHGGRLSVTSAQ